MTGRHYLVVEATDTNQADYSVHCERPTGPLCPGFSAAEVDAQVIRIEIDLGTFEAGDYQIRPTDRGFVLISPHTRRELQTPIPI